MLGFECPLRTSVPGWYRESEHVMHGTGVVLGDSLR
jgi:hypothetical protein